jgi:heme/copper-type cytochrome/quinol oxidase subunit 3
MEIPYTVKPRPDTGLSNPKLGIWLFIASEVMLFGGLFAGYIFMRVGAEPGFWPHGWLNVPIGTMNTFILILSSVTVILSWESLKMRRYKAFKNWLAVTWICGLIFLGVKLGKEWPDKFSHFGAYVTKEHAEKYDQYLGNKDVDGEKGRISRNAEPNYFISGHVEDMKQASVPFITDAWLASIVQISEGAPAKDKDKLVARRLDNLHSLALTEPEIQSLLSTIGDPAEAAKHRAEILTRINTITLVGLDEINANKPTSEDHDRPHFWPRSMEHMHEGHEVKLQKADLVPNFGAFLPRLNTYLATYFMITGLHGLHVLGGVIVFFYFWITSKKWFEHHHQQLCNRIEVSGLFWHLVDLIWIFVFPLFYLL